jgi:hypothetical protein
MTLKNTLLLGILGALTSQSLCAMSPHLITMPSAQVLNERLSGIGLQHFAEKTDLIKQLAGDSHPLSIVMFAVDKSVSEYNARLYNTGTAEAEKPTMPTVVKVLLQNYPGVLDMLAFGDLLE